MFCSNCGKEIKDGATFCPECGAAQQGTTPPPTSNVGNYATPTSQSTVQKAPYNTMCIVGLVISCISLLLNFWGLVGIAGTVVSVIGLNSCKQKNENRKGSCNNRYCNWCISILYGLIAIFEPVTFYHVL